MSEKVLSGTAAIVTGASRGIGFAIARGLASSGCSVCVTARNPEGLIDAVNELSQYGEVLGVAGKADSQEHQAEAVDKTMARFGRIDFLVNNAGTNPQVGPLVEATLGAVEKVIAVNLVAPLSWTQRVWNAWMSDNGGAILNISSTGGLQTAQTIGAYNISKAGLIHLTAQLALELGPKVRVNALAPGLVKTQFAKALYEENESEIAGLFPLKRLGVPEDISGAAVFLLGPDSSWITGSTLVVDGGEMTVSAI
jgi:NAD(P)-dependent dehydrogenase (short-subunit alcohol dehydrogenase family)